MSDPTSDHPDSSAGLSPQDSGVAADSVLPSLMQVYNTMMQSKTPEGDPRGPLAPGDLYATAPDAARAAGPGAAPSNATDWNTYAAATAGANSMSLPSIPPIPTALNNDAKPASTTEPVASSARALRKRSSTSSIKGDSPTPSVTSGRGSKTRRKAKDTDARWSKRFSWPEDLHRDFVAAIFDVGLKHSSPSTILESMPKHEQITSERVKSHLQKYRIHRIKSKREFMASYDSGLKKIKEGTIGTISAGEVASFLAHNSMNETDSSQQEEEQEENRQQLQSRPATVESEEKNSNEGKDTVNPQDILTLPRLSEAEKQSPIGASMGYLMGLFFSLKQQLMAQRAAAAEGAQLASKSKKNESSSTAAAAVYESFVAPVPIAPNTVLPGSDPAAALPLPTSSAAPQATTVVSNPSTRSNLEENNMMKREMRNQMAFQNKMRGLKQQELNKFRNAEADRHASATSGMTTAASGIIPHPAASVPAAVGTAAENATSDAMHQQGAGEVAGDGERAGVTRGLSIGGAEEFWNTDVMDEQLFEFLMSEG